MLDRVRQWFVRSLFGEAEEKAERKDVRAVVAEAAAEMARAKPTGPAIEKMRLHQVMGRCVRLIIRDRQKVLAQIDAENRALSAAASEGDGQFLAMPDEVLAIRLWDGWTEEERDGIAVEAGYYIVQSKAWLVVRGKPELVEEPFWAYVIDPFPTGVTLYDQIFEPAPRIKVVEPFSPDSRMYSAVSGVLRPKAE
jgi:hypothetical protein